MCSYAALDVFASYLIFEKAQQVSPIERPQLSSPAGTPVSLLARDGGEPVAYGTISSNQPQKLGSVRVQTRKQDRLVLDINTIVNPAAAAIFHLTPLSSSAGAKKTKSGSLTLGQLQSASTSPVFQIVAPLRWIKFDHRNPVCHIISLCVEDLVLM